MDSLYCTIYFLLLGYTKYGKGNKQRKINRFSRCTHKHALQGFSLASALGHSLKIVPDVREFAVQFGQFVQDDFHLCIYKSLIREKLSKFSQLSYC